MHLVVSYDISCPHKSEKIRKLLKKLGIHSQKSVFECEILSTKVLDTILSRIESILKEHDKKGFDGSKDSVLFYPLCNKCANSVVIIGKNESKLNSNLGII